MKINEINQKIRNIGVSKINFDKFLNQLNTLKTEFVRKQQQEEAKKIWIYEQIIEIHQLYLVTFDQIKQKEYYQAWCNLEKLEIKFSNLKLHYEYDINKYKLFFIEQRVINLQVLFPYRLFSSTEFIYQEVKCSICNEVVTIRNNCGHQISEIYNGEMCHRIVSKSKLLGIALVENPVHKYAVIYKGQDDKNDIGYTKLKYIMAVIDDPYESWGIIIEYIRVPHSEFECGAEDLCPCESNKKYSECCLNEEGVKVEHTEFLLKQSTYQKIKKSENNVLPYSTPNVVPS